MNFPSMSQINILLNIIDKIRNYCIWIFKSKPKFKKSPYYFKKYHKHATVYDNGNGIIIISFDITFNNKDVNRLVRGVNISDGKLSAVFQSLENMKELSLKERFDKCGFWVYSDENIIEEIKEEYWLDDDKEQEDIAAKNDKKEIRWVFKLNVSKIELHKPYHVVYVISIPGMFPILNGKIDFSEIDKTNLDEYSSSSIDIWTPIEQLKYTVSFYNSIDLQTEPEAIFKAIGDGKCSYPPIKKEYNIIYNRYICYMKRPQLGSNLRVRWKFKKDD